MMNIFIALKGSHFLFLFEKYLWIWFKSIKYMYVYTPYVSVHVRTALKVRKVGHLFSILSLKFDTYTIIRGVKVLFLAPITFNYNFLII